MQEYEQAVFISYAWGTEREEIVNQIDEALQDRGIKIIRDKRVLSYKGSISEFMERIGQGNCVILVISDKYLRSPNCMFELVEIAENKQFHDRIFPIVLGDANIYDPVKRTKYVKYWEDKRAELVEAIKKLDPANLQGIREDMDLYDRIRDKISGLSSTLKDMNTLTPDMHRDSDFSELYNSIEKRMQETPAKPSLQPFLSKNSKAFYSGVLFIVAVLAFIGFITLRNNRAANTANFAETAIVTQPDFLTATANAESSANENDANGGPGAITASTLTPIVTGTATPTTPPLACLDRWALNITTEDSSISTEPFSENDCITAYKDLGISVAAGELSFLQNSFGTQGKFGLITPLPKDPEFVSLKVNFSYLSGGGQGEFWITLSNGPDPAKDSISIALQPDGSIKYYQDDKEVTRHTLQPVPSSYEITLKINGIDVSSDVNSSSSTLMLPVNGGPNYLFLGYSKKASGGTITMKVDVSDLEFK